MTIESQRTNAGQTPAALLKRDFNTVKFANSLKTPVLKNMYE